MPTRHIESPTRHIESVEAFRSRCLERAKRKGVKLGDQDTLNRFFNPNDTSPVYVLNLTAIYVDDTRRSRATPLVLDVGNQTNGTTAPLVIPDTWIPFCVTHEYPKSVLLNSSPFTQSIARGDLVLVDPQEAVRILGTDDGRREMERVQRGLRNRNTPSRTAVEERHAQVESLQRSGHAPSLPKVERHQEMDHKDALAAAASPTVVDFCVRALNSVKEGGDLTPSDLVDFLEMEVQSFTKQDYTYFDFILGDMPPSISQDDEVRQALARVRESVNY